MEIESKIYVAGHNGLVGSALVRALRRRGYTNLLSRSRGELDLTSQADVHAFFETEKPDCVFLAAAKVGGILSNDTFKADFLYENTIIAANVLHAAWKSGVRKLLNLGSSCIYPKFAPQPITEESLLSGPLEPTNEPYAIAKIAALKMCRYFNEQYGTDFLSVMPTNLYGEGDNFDLFNAHVLPAMLRKFHLATLLAAGNRSGIRSNLARHPDTAKIAGKSDAEQHAFLAGLGITADRVTLWGTGPPAGISPCGRLGRGLPFPHATISCPGTRRNYQRGFGNRFGNPGACRDDSRGDRFSRRHRMGCFPAGRYAAQVDGCKPFATSRLDGGHFS